MKKTFRLMTLALMGAAMIGFAACGDDDDDSKNTGNNDGGSTTETPYYALSYEGNTLANGDTVTYDASGDNFQSMINLYVTNLTDGALSTTQYTDQVEGNYEYAVCYGGQCPPQQDNVFNLPAGLDEVMSLITIEAHLNSSEGAALFKLTVGQGSAKAHAVTAYIRMTR